MADDVKETRREALARLRVLDAHDDVEEVRQFCASGRFCWLDLDNPDRHAVQEMGDALGLHPLAIEDTQEFDQRPKADRHGEQLLIVYYGAVPAGPSDIRLVEVHIHISNRFVLTVHRDPIPPLAKLHARVREQAPEDQETLVYQILDTLTDSLQDYLDQALDTVAQQEAQVYVRPRARDRRQMAQLRRSLDSCRRSVASQRQQFERMIQRVDELPGLRAELRPNYDDISDHLWRAVDDLETARDSLGTLLDQYSNALSERLTIVATIFLPLTFLTGFFGQNFNWLVNHIGSVWAFFGLGLGGLVVSVLAIWLWMIRTGMYDRPGHD